MILHICTYLEFNLFICLNTQQSNVEFYKHTKNFITTTGLIGIFLCYTRQAKTYRKYLT